MDYPWKSSVKVATILLRRGCFYVCKTIWFGTTKTNISGSVTSYLYDIFNEIQSVGTTSYTHDNNGNIIKAGVSDFVYNAENQLEQFLYNGVSAANYVYDWRGLRTKKTVGSKTELYYYTDNDLTYITDQDNNLKYYFVRDLNGRLLQMIDYTASPAKSYIYIHDVHGNVIGLADDTGILVNYEFDSYGNLLNTPQTGVLTGNGEPLANANPFRYSGYQYDPETQLYYLKYRYYVPSLGRFLTRDPMISYNRYMYCSNNPVNFVDPLGLADAELEPGHYEKYVYIPFKYPVIIDNKARTGTFVNTSNKKDFQDYGTKIGKVQIKADLLMPVKKESVIVSYTITKVKIQTYSSNGTRQVRVNYYGPAQFPVIDRASNYSQMITSVGAIGVTGVVIGKVIQVNELLVSGLFASAALGLYAANNEFKPDWLLETDEYTLDK